MIDLEHKTYYINLFDCYQKLLTNKQIKIFKYYFFEDFSYAEIAKLFNISRAGVCDIIQRIIKQLFKYQDKLNMYQGKIKK